MFRLFAINRHATTSIPDRNAYPKKLLNTAFVWPVQPSAIFNTTESAARLIWDVSIKSSSFGKLLVRMAISLVRSNAFCQTCKFSNLNAIAFAMVYGPSTMDYFSRYLKGVWLSVDKNQFVDPLKTASDCGNNPIYPSRVPLRSLLPRQP